jgi:antitoxin component YwqK of YwqJK toxin-antitoxin module
MRIYLSILFCLVVYLNSFSQQGCSIDREAFITLPEIFYKNEQVIKAVFSCKIVSNSTMPNGDYYSIGEIQNVFFGKTSLKQIKILTGGSPPLPTPQPPILLAIPTKSNLKPSYDVPFETGTIDREVFTHSSYPHSWGLRMLVDSIYLIYTENDSSYNQIYNDRNKLFKKNPSILNEIETLKTLKGIFNNKKTGHYTFKDEHGVLLAEGNYKKGKLSGIWKNYTFKGNLFSWEEFKKDEYKSYYVSGHLKEKIKKYKDSTVTINYADNSKLQLSKIITVKNDSGLHATIYEYNKDGIITAIHGERTYKMTRYNGLYREYFSNGKIKTISEYKFHVENYRCGIYQEYYPTGQLKLDAYVYNARRVGCWTWYNDDGTFWAEWDYKDGKAPQ